MPGVIVKLWPGKSERQKQRLADAIAEVVMEVLEYGKDQFLLASKKFRRMTGQTKF